MGTMRTVRVHHNAALTAWTTVVAERLGYDHDEALTLAGAVGRLAYYQAPHDEGPVEASEVQPVPEQPPDTPRWRKAKDYVEIMRRTIPVVHTAAGVRALASPYRTVSPARVERYCREAFGAALEPTLKTMRELAHAHAPEALAERAYPLYTQFRPPAAVTEVGALPEVDLNLERIAELKPQT